MASVKVVSGANLARLVGMRPKELMAMFRENDVRLRDGDVLVVTWQGLTERVFEPDLEADEELPEG